MGETARATRGETKQGEADGRGESLGGLIYRAARALLIGDLPDVEQGFRDEYAVGGRDTQ